MCNTINQKLAIASFHALGNTHEQVMLFKQVFGLKKGKGLLPNIANCAPN